MRSAVSFAIPESLSSNGEFRWLNWSWQRLTNEKQSKIFAFTLTEALQLFCYIRHQLLLSIALRY